MQQTIKHTCSRLTVGFLIALFALTGSLAGVSSGGPNPKDGPPALPPPAPNPNPIPGPGNPTPPLPLPGGGG